jgi:hypothetical protein
MTIIFPHIPKCGGTSILQELGESGLKVYLDYDHPPNPTNAYMQRECGRRNREHQMLDFSNFDIVFGHYPIERYNRGSYSYVTLLRDPLERAISHFNYWKELPATNMLAVQRNPIISGIQTGTVDFIKFVEQQKLGTFYRRFLCEAHPGNFILIGLLEEYREFAEQLSNLLGATIDGSTHARPGSSSAAQIEPLKLQIAREMLAPDFALYEEFKSFRARTMTRNLSIAKLP